MRAPTDSVPSGAASAQAHERRIRRIGDAHVAVAGRLEPGESPVDPLLARLPERCARVRIPERRLQIESRRLFHGFGNDDDLLERLPRLPIADRAHRRQARIQLVATAQGMQLRQQAGLQRLSFES